MSKQGECHGLATQHSNIKIMKNYGKKKEMLFSISLRDTTKFPRDLLQVKHGKMFTKTSDAYVQIEIIQVHQK